MKLEYLHDLTANGKFKDVVSENLIRLWDFGPEESKLFQNLIHEFVKDEQKNQLIVDEQDFIEPINCKLILTKDIANSGISRIGPNEFICKLDKKGYQHMVGLIEPFSIEESGGYQWLNEKADITDIDFLFSPGGSW